MKPSELPSTLLQAVAYFQDSKRCHDFMMAMRWPDGVHCAHCKSTNIGNLVESETKSRGTKRNPLGKIFVRRLWNCKACKKQFTVKTGTLFEDSPIGLEKWLPAVWMIVNAKNGVSSYELSRSLGVTQKSAWFMSHRIRAAMTDKSGAKLFGEVEADEAWIGGKTANMHASKRRALPTPFSNKTPVVGAIQRSKHKGGSRVLLNAVCGPFSPGARDHVYSKVKEGSKLYTDAAGHYTEVGAKYFDHEFVDHAIEYARGNVHTNGMENFWALLKRTIKGTYVSVSRYHLFRYLDEQARRFNERSDDDRTRFLSTIERIPGMRLQYRMLTGIGLI